MEETPVLFSRQTFVSSVIKSAMCNGFAGMTGTPILEDAHPRHLNQPDLYLFKVDGALDPNCKSRRSGTRLRSNGSSKAAASLQIPEIRTSEKQKHKVNETKNEKLKSALAAHTKGNIGVEEDIQNAMVSYAALTCPYLINT